MERDLIRALQLKGIRNSISSLLVEEITEGMEGYLGSLINHTIEASGPIRYEGREVDVSKERLFKLDLALQNCARAEITDQWLRKVLDESLMSGKAEEEQKSILAEIEAFGFLSIVFGNDSVMQITEGKEKTPDFNVGNDLFVEVYCPDVTTDHKERIASLNAPCEGKNTDGVTLKTVLSRPLIGNEKLAITYATNQVINRIVGAKRENDQTIEGKQNILWLDLSYKTEQVVQDCLPCRSINHCDQTYVGCTGIWNAFYGEKGVSRFATDRLSLRWSRGVESETYIQRDYTGLFRERDTLSAAIISCKDGLVLFQNPWAALSSQLTEENLKKLIKLPMFRPEYSWFSIDALNLAQRVDQYTKDFNWLLLASKNDVEK